MTDDLTLDCCPTCGYCSDPTHWPNELSADMARIATENENLRRQIEVLQQLNIDQGRDIRRFLEYHHDCSKASL